MSMLQIAPLVQAFQALWNQLFESVRRTDETLNEELILNLESDPRHLPSRSYDFAFKSTSTTLPS